MKSIKYSDISDYKFRLKSYYEIKTGLKFKKDYDIYDYVYLYSDGLLCIEKGYAWNGISGGWFVKTICGGDNKKNIRSTLTHDALYQLMGFYEAVLNKRVDVDNLFKKTLIEDGTGNWMASRMSGAVKTFGGSSAKEKQSEKILTAP